MPLGVLKSFRNLEVSFSIKLTAIGVKGLKPLEKQLKYYFIFSHYLFNTSE